MKIIVDRGAESGKGPIVTIDTDVCYGTKAFKDSFTLALRIEGLSEDFINAIFNLAPVENKENASTEE